MSWVWTLLWILGSVYLLGFTVTLYFHITELQMVTPSLALVRSLVWPIYLFTGWPHGVPLTVD